MISYDQYLRGCHQNNDIALQQIHHLLSEMISHIQGEHVLICAGSFGLKLLYGSMLQVMTWILYLKVIHHLLQKIKRTCPKQLKSGWSNRLTNYRSLFNSQDMVSVHMTHKQRADDILICWLTHLMQKSSNKDAKSGLIMLPQYLVMIKDYQLWSF